MNKVTVRNVLIAAVLALNTGGCGKSEPISFAPIFPPVLTGNGTTDITNNFPGGGIPHWSGDRDFDDDRVNDSYMWKKLDDGRVLIYHTKSTEPRTRNPNGVDHSKTNWYLKIEKK